MKRQCQQTVSYVLCMIALVAVLVGTAGCQTSEPAGMGLAQAAPVSGGEPATVRLHPGDVVQVSFPGAPSLNTTERVRLDGNLLLPLVGEVPAGGKTPSELQADLAKLYSKHLQVKEVVVIVASSSASVFVGGAVAKPGRIAMERPMTVLDAIMEAGGFDPKRANVKKVAVIRQQDGKYSRHSLNLKPVLKGENVPPFNLEPFDIVFVPDKVF
jgi:polysaccharide biosynthesis/export protein